MSMTINLNGAAQNAAANLRRNDSALSASISKLSSGYRINNAADDPAGLVISENMRAQISGITQALSNSQDAVNLVKTAEGALTEVNSLLNSMRTLAVHAANTGVNNADSIAADQQQITSAISSLDNIAQRTTFGGTKLLDGSAGISANTYDSMVKSFTAATTGSAFTASGDVEVNVTQTALQAKVAGDVVYQTAGANDATKTFATLAAATDTITVNGVNVGTFSATSTVQNVLDAVNNNSQLKGSVVADQDTAGHIRITSVGYGNDKSVIVNETTSAGTQGIITNVVAAAGSGTTTAATGRNAIATVTGGGIAGQVFSSGTGLTLKNAQGDTIVLDSTATGDIAVGFKVNAGTARQFQIGAYANDTASVSFNSTKSADLGQGASSTFASIANIKITDAATATEAIKVIDQAIKDVSTHRADLGAFQKNVLQSNMNSLSVAKENIAASESAIRDTDMASEMANFTRLNIMEQAGTAMLTQANQLPQQLLSLLKG